MSIRLNHFAFANDNPMVLLGGLNVLESRDLAMRVAERMTQITHELNIPYVFKASFDKANRSSIHSFRGPGLIEGMKILEDIKAAFDVPVMTDIHDPMQAKPVAEIAEILQIPAFLCRQTDLIVAAAKTNRILNVKKAQFLAAHEMRHVIQKCKDAGNDQVMLCERGTSFGYNNLIVDTLNFPIMKAFDVPVIFDVTHALQLPGGRENSAGGRREYLPDLARAGVAQRLAGLFLEVHPNPDEAMCDGPCAWPLDQVKPLLQQLKELDQVVKQQVSHSL